jgi:hypothetical protein
MMGPLGLYYGEDEGLWEITVFPCLVELHGDAGETDVLAPTFSMDLKSLWSAFEDIAEMHWNAHPFGPDGHQGAYIAVEGRYQGHEIWLSVLAEAPEGEEPAIQIDPAEFVADDSATKH